MDKLIIRHAGESLWVVPDHRLRGGVMEIRHSRGVFMVGQGDGTPAMHTEVLGAISAALNRGLRGLSAIHVSPMNAQALALELVSARPFAAEPRSCSCVDAATVYRMETRDEVAVPRAVLRAAAKLFPDGVAIDAVAMEHRVTELLALEKGTGSNPRHLQLFDDDQLRAECNRRWGEDDCPMAKTLRHERDEWKAHHEAATKALNDALCPCGCNVQREGSGHIAGPAMALVGRPLRVLVEADTHAARIPHADAMRFTCADGTTVDVAFQALLRATADARSEKAAERRYQTFGGDPLMDAALTMATAPDRPQAALDAIRDVDALCLEQAQKGRDLAANARFRATHGEPGSDQKHDRIGSKCTLPHCPHPHEPAPTESNIDRSMREMRGFMRDYFTPESQRQRIESGPGIARLPEPRPEPLAFLDEDLLCEDE